MEMDSKKKFTTGGLVPSEGRKEAVLHNGCCLVSRSQYEKIGAFMIRVLNNSPDCEILVVPDEKLEGMSPSEKMQLLNECR